MNAIAEKTPKPSMTRFIWLFTMVYVLLPLLGTVPAMLTGNLLYLILPLFIIYFALPIVDEIIGQDKNDLLGLVEDQADTPLYKAMLYACLPLLVLTWVFGAWYVMTHNLPWYGYLAATLCHGWGLAFAIGIGHETGHKTDKLSKWFAIFMLAPSFYGHFRIEHNHGHHSAVATPKDSATARFGESYWAFMLREVPGALKRAWSIESRRAARKGYSKFSPKNEVVAASLISLTMWSLLILWLGIGVIPYILITWFVSVSALSAQNYFAHYGMLREKRENGSYIPCQPHHSWNCNYLVTNLITFNLGRHSDHHAHPYRSYQRLRPFEESPHLPFGYGTMILLCYVPPLFRKVMDPLVLKNAGGDMSKVLTKELAAAEGY